LNILPRINFCGVLTVLCSEIRHCAKRQNVSRHPKKRPYKKRRLTIWTAKRKLKEIKTVNLLDLNF
jgi:hypothetical protein